MPRQGGPGAGRNPGGVVKLSRRGFLNWQELPVQWWGFQSFAYAGAMVMLVPGLLAVMVLVTRKEVRAFLSDQPAEVTS